MSIKTKKVITNFFGGVAYFICCLQWLLVVVIYSSFIRSTLTSFTPVATRPIQPSPVPIDLHTNTLVMIIAIIFTILVVVFAVYIFVKIPMTVVKASKKIVHEAAESVAPVILHTQHIPETTQNHKKIVFRMTIVIKTLIIIVPFAAAFCSQFSTNQVLGFNVTMYLAVILGTSTTTFFFLQYICARAWSIHKSDLW